MQGENLGMTDRWTGATSSVVSGMLHEGFQQMTEQFHMATPGDPTTNGAMQPAEGHASATARPPGEADASPTRPPSAHRRRLWTPGADRPGRAEAVATLPEVPDLPGASSHTGLTQAAAAMDISGEV